MNDSRRKDGIIRQNLREMIFQAAVTAKSAEGKISRKAESLAIGDHGLDRYLVAWQLSHLLSKFLEI